MKLPLIKYQIYFKPKQNAWNLLFIFHTKLQQHMGDMNNYFTSFQIYIFPRKKVQEKYIYLLQEA